MSNAARHEGDQGDQNGERRDPADALQAALKAAMRRVLREHAQAGRKVVIWKEGEVVWEDPLKKDG